MPLLACGGRLVFAGCGKGMTAGKDRPFLRREEAVSADIVGREKGTYNVVWTVALRCTEYGVGKRL